MSDDKPTSTEPELSKLSISAEPTETSKSNGTNAAAAAFTPGRKFDWAEESTTPDATEPSDKTLGEDKDKNLDGAQKDGATTWMMGSEGLDEPEFDVNVKLADLQEDPNNPLYSVKSFEELNLYVDTQALSGRAFY
jgi:ATP-dependent RNA helicase DDX19/DBP5